MCIYCFIYLIFVIIIYLFCMCLEVRFYSTVSILICLLMYELGRRVEKEMSRHEVFSAYLERCIYIYMYIYLKIKITDANYSLFCNTVI